MGYAPAVVNINELKARAVSALEIFDYPTRAAALRLVGCGDQIGSVLDDTVAHPKLRENLMCLAHMAFGGIVEYYGAWDVESAGWTVSREYLLAEELGGLDEADWLSEGTGMFELERKSTTQHNRNRRWRSPRGRSRQAATAADHPGRRPGVT